LREAASRSQSALADILVNIVYCNNSAAINRFWWKLVRLPRGGPVRHWGDQ